MKEKDYYTILGVSADAKREAIKDAYRALAFRYHPDRNKDNQEASDRMKAVNEAYAVLSDPDKRREYDILRRQFGTGAYDRFRGSYSRADIFRDSDIHQVFETMANRFGFRGYEEVFKEFYGTGYKSFNFSQPGFFAKGFVFFGPLSGKGQRENFFPMTGRIGQAIRFLTKKASEETLSEKSPDVHEVLQLSPEQADKGGPYAYFAEHRSKKLIVKVPPKVREGQQIRLAGMGNVSKAGTTPGDLYLQVKIRRPLLEKVTSFLRGWRQDK